MTSGVIMASLPPATTMSQRSSRSRSRAVPMAVAPEAQAVATTRLGPLAPNSMAVWPASMLGSCIGSSSGETRAGDSSTSTRCWVSTVPGPPSAQPRMTPTRAPSQVCGSSPASAIASRAATSANWVKRSSRWARRPPSSCPGSQSGTRQEIRTGFPSRAGSSAAVGRPARTAAQEAAVPMPAGVTRPSPVTATSMPAIRPVRSALRSGAPCHRWSRRRAARRR